MSTKLRHVSQLKLTTEPKSISFSPSNIYLFEFILLPEKSVHFKSTNELRNEISSYHLNLTKNISSRKHNPGKTSILSNLLPHNNQIRTTINVCCSHHTFHSQTSAPIPARIFFTELSSHQPGLIIRMKLLMNTKLQPRPGFQTIGLTKHLG